MVKKIVVLSIVLVIGLSGMEFVQAEDKANEKKVKLDIRSYVEPGEETADKIDPALSSRVERTNVIEGGRMIVKPPLIQMAVLLDTSGSMSGLIEQAKTQLWTIVNEFALAKRDGQVPMLQVGLYEYGKSSIPAKEGYIRMILPLTTDLDKVSEELFALKTNGGDEYCGKVIKSATESLAWSKSNDDMKMIVIAGNEPGGCGLPGGLQSSHRQGNYR